MRKIKFRGISTDTGKWLVGALIPNGKSACIAPFGELFHLEEVNPDTVGEFTGMLDKNGMEIFEGDIVRYYDDVEGELVVRPVEYLNDYCAFCAVHPRKDPDGLFAQWQYEVIGNIYNNKEQKGGNTDGED